MRWKRRYARHRRRSRKRDSRHSAPVFIRTRPLPCGSTTARCRAGARTASRSSLSHTSRAPSSAKRARLPSTFLRAGRRRRAFWTCARSSICPPTTTSSAATRAARSSTRTVPSSACYSTATSTRSRDRTGSTRKRTAPSRFTRPSCARRSARCTAPMRCSPSLVRNSASIGACEDPEAHAHLVLHLQRPEQGAERLQAEIRLTQGELSVRQQLSAFLFVAHRQREHSRYVTNGDLHRRERTARGRLELLRDDRE